MSEALPLPDTLNSTPKTYARLAVFLNILATTQLVWFYLTRVECYIRLPHYEQGVERTPFQYRLLMMGPLIWAHHSRSLNNLAIWLTSQRGWFPNGVRSEGIVQAAIDFASIAVAGLVARKMYRLSSRTGLLTIVLYPLTLLMILTTYSLQTMHSYRFVYDLPALAFFSLGLYLIYIRRHLVWFVIVFMLGTINRETTLLLLVFYVLAECGRRNRFDWRRCYAGSTVKVIVPLGAYWLAWRLLVEHLFRANASIAQPRWWLNVGILAIPFSWPQLLCAFSYSLPLVLVLRHHIRDAVLHAWLYALPIWFLFMLYYGVFVETRIFGELIPYIACVSALIAEERILIRSGSFAPQRH